MRALKHRDHYKKPQTLWLGSSCSGHPSLVDESALILFLIPGFTLARRLPITALQRITLPKATTVITSLSCLTYAVKKSHVHVYSKRTATYVRICRSNSLLVPKLTLNLSAITTIFSILYIPHLSPYTMFNVYVLSQQSQSKGKFLLLRIGRNLLASTTHKVHSILNIFTCAQS